MLFNRHMDPSGATEKSSKRTRGATRMKDLLLGRNRDIRLVVKFNHVNFSLGKIGRNLRAMLDALLMRKSLLTFLIGVQFARS